MDGHCPKDCGYDGCLKEDGLLKDCKGCWVAKKGAKWIYFEKNPAF